MRALLSVYDKEGVVDLARGLAALGVEIFSTGGTLRALTEAGLEARSVSDLSGFPEILDGRVKTLHPAIHAGILADRENEEHLTALRDHDLQMIDLVVVNLYPFVETVSADRVDLPTAVEKIDIGGPTLIRAAAKNFAHVLVVTDPADYPAVLDELRRRAEGAEGRDYGLSKRLAAKAFAVTASYDAYVSAYMRSLFGEQFPQALVVPLRKVVDLRYGENPHQQAAFYTTVPTTETIGLRTLASARQLHGKELSFTNLLDLDAAWTTVRDFVAPCVVVIKHTNPCGLACGSDLVDTYRRAHAGDPQAAYGGILGFNRTVDEAVAEAMRPAHYDAVVAPEFSPEALRLLTAKRDLRLVAMGERSAPRKGEFGWLPDNKLDFKRITGGFVVQHRNALPETDVQMEVVTKRRPTLDEVTDLRFAWRAVKHTKSNAIVLATGLSIVGVGAGQMKRVDSVELAIRHAKDRAQGSVLASDAYFPFADGVERALEAGVTAIIQPGGSIRDQQSIEAADHAGAAMVFTGVRQFKH
ncbi:MAG: bifunctional phosphoribosylaminoimidazolecarboxamide formyltransferase/IMP cyclohydrolase [Chloroflexota bacterium]